MTRIRRRPVGSLATVTAAVLCFTVLGLMTAGCGVPERAVALVLTATGAEPAPTLPEPARRLLKDMASEAERVRGAIVRLVVSGPPGMPQQSETDLTPYRSPNKVEHSSTKERKIEDKLVELESSVAGRTSSVDGLDLLGLLDRAAAGDAERIIVVSSGLSTTAPMDWRQLGWELDPHEVASRLAEGGWLPDLRGHRVTFYGLGQVAGSQPQLHMPGRDLVKDLWIEVCTAAGGISCEAVDDGSALSPPTATRPVPVVDVPPAEQPPKNCTTRTVLDNRSLGFRRNSADLHATADLVLGPYAELLGTCAVADIVGHVADVGQGDDVELSERRARAVADRLVLLGACPASIRTVAGRGDTEPVEVNWNPDGTFNEPKAAKNRRVDLRLTATASLCA